MVLIKKSSNKGFSFEYVDRTEVRTDIPINEFVRMQHDNNGRVFDDSQYYLPLLNRDNDEANKRALKRVYYQLHQKDYVLDEYRLRHRDENSYLQDVKVILELIKIFHLAAKQKVYEPIINPLNFIYNEDTEKVSVFYRKNSFLEEESFIWLDDRFPGARTVTKAGCADIDKLVQWGAAYGLKKEWIHKKSEFPHFDLLGETQKYILEQENLTDHLLRFHL